MATSGIPRTAPASNHVDRAARATDDAALREEARRFGRYLLGAPPSDELVERYARAHDHVLREPPTPADAAILGFAGAHPWSLALLDAGTAVVGSAPLLRRKLLVMMAILEATPDHADRMIPRGGVALPRLLLRLARAGAVSAVKMAAGAALAVIVTRAPGGGAGAPR
jgi:hypothetical protein